MKLTINCNPEEYAEFAVQCNQQNLRIERQGDEWVGVTPPEVTLAELKADLISSFKDLRDTSEVEPITYGGHTYDFDDKARERLRIARQTFEDNNLEKQAWTTADNQLVELTVADFKAINTAAAVRSGSLHVKYNNLKEQVNNCETKDELKDIKW